MQKNIFLEIQWINESINQYSLMIFCCFNIFCPTIAVGRFRFFIIANRYFLTDDYLMPFSLQEFFLFLKRFFLFFVKKIQTRPRKKTVYFAKNNLYYEIMKTDFAQKISSYRNFSCKITSFLLCCWLAFFSVKINIL